MLLQLADTTFQAITQVGVVTSIEIEIAVDEIMREGTEIADQLDELAKAIRHHSSVASEYVTKFCVNATSVLERVVELQNVLLQNKPIRPSGRTPGLLPEL